MQQPQPNPAEPVLPQSGERSLGRGLAYGGFIALLAVCGWMRFSNQIADFAPNLAAPNAPAAQTASIRGLLELKLMPLSQESVAIQAMALPSGDAAALSGAANRRRVRLVQMPVYENDGAIGSMVEVASGGFTRTVLLSSTPTVLTLPIDHMGVVSFRLLGPSPPGGLGIGAITLGGPIGLPPLANGQVLEVGVIAQ